MESSPEAGARHHAAVLPADQRHPLKAGQKGHSNLAIAKRELGVGVDKTLQSQNWMEAELTEADIDTMGDVRLT